MANDVAVNFRKNRGRSDEAVESPARGGLSTLVLVVGAMAIGFAGYSFAPASLSLASVASLWRGQAPAARPASADSTPRQASVVPGVREVGGGAMGLPIVGTASLSQVYSPVGPVVIRKRDGYVEIDGPGLIPPPIGPRRSSQSIFDHGARLATALAPLSYTPCDSHLRYLAAANINLFVGGFMAPRTPVDPRAAADTAFWRKPEAGAVRRAALILAEKGAFGPADFGIDASPQARGLFEGITPGRPACG
ncbi:MAG: hypothetical protein FD152_1838 [Xanthobacteraceae bacterium]|nr:MAG: hypothetical protein FD152_1838 [Xanthobacteraceae bacterium]